jgi:hypothetical protein
LDCGVDDPFEVALATGPFHENGDIIVTVEIEAAMVCPEPGSNRHDPYAWVLGVK